MVYLKSFSLPSANAETSIITNESRTCFNSFYPFGIFPNKELRSLSFDSVTMLYGGNGSGKSTLINVISQRVNAVRTSDFNDSPFFDKYVDMCYAEWVKRPMACNVLTSDDVFDYALSARSVNEKIDEERNALFDRYRDKYFEALENPEILRLDGLHDYERWSELHEIISPRKSQSRYVKKRVASNVDLYSNGETAIRYFLKRIDGDGLYLLDEPENSLSVELQKELAEYISATVRASKTQFIIATHSPILLSMKGAKIYNLDEYPVSVSPWTELPNVRKFFDFFMEHSNEF